MRMTKWFPHTIKPVRVGWYQTQMEDKRFGYSCWDGFLWSCQHNDYFCVLAKAVCWNGASQNKKWRGIAK